MLCNKLATSHVWLPSTGNVAMDLGTESYILINSNLNSCLELVTTLLDGWTSISLHAPMTVRFAGPSWDLLFPGSLITKWIIHFGTF